MRHRITFSLVVLVIFAAAGITQSSAAAVVFARTLRAGDRGSDVLALQRLLNKDPDTRIAVTGSGSPGQETGYFGVKTAAAVVRFQEKYRLEILIPASLLRGTGIVGSLTRAKLQLLTATPTPAITEGIPPPIGLPIPPAVVTPTAPVPPQAKPRIDAITPTLGMNGTVVTINGSGFEATANSLYTSYATLSNLPSVDGRTIVFTLNPPLHQKPHHLHLPIWIYVRNGGGESNPAVFTYGD